MFTEKGTVIATKPFTNKNGENKSDCVVVETEKGYRIGFISKGTLYIGDKVTVITVFEDGRWSVKFVQ